MNELIDRLEKRWGHYAIKNLTLWIIVGQVIVLFLMALSEIDAFPAFPLDLLHLNGDRLLVGQVWRVFTFLFFPLGGSLFWLIIGWIFMHLAGSVLEEEWGAFKYNCYVLIYAVATSIAAILCSFFVPGLSMPNWLLYMTLIMAFAYVQPDREIMLFFVLPVKMKWIGLLMLGRVALFLFEPLPFKLMAIAGIVNFWLFFGKDIRERRAQATRRRAHETQQREEAEAPFHLCKVCGATDKTNPDSQFYYKKGEGYCEACLEEMPD